MPANSRFTINPGLLAASFDAPQDSSTEFNLQRFGATPAELDAERARLDAEIARVFAAL